MPLNNGQFHLKDTTILAEALASPRSPRAIGLRESRIATYLFIGVVVLVALLEGALV
jgi:hypothetical protein